ncbi:hypothetical protein Ahy_A06g028943 isoform A [Arachis hypogaea]|uniref:Uncharacterized protein n=1 Tax=Arachis hypogaea TaxID=3818 RepID=A0A445CRY6_ARAHY|nr:hypothetical protein Ahy_A06g028943 isoform A [Arachis hypogaea]
MESLSSSPSLSVWDSIIVLLVRPVLAIAFVISIIALGWFVAWKLVLVHVPLVQEIFGLKKKTVRSKPPTVLCGTCLSNSNLMLGYDSLELILELVGVWQQRWPVKPRIGARASFESKPTRLKKEKEETMQCDWKRELQLGTRESKKDGIKEERHHKSKVGQHGLSCVREFRPHTPTFCVCETSLACLID